MTVLEQAEDLRKRAIELLLGERNLIDEKLLTIGYDGAIAEIKKGAARKCGKCGSPDHNARTCTPVIPEGSPA